MRVNIKPLSANDAWRGRRFKTPQYKVFQSEMLYKLPPLELPPPPFHIKYKIGFSSKGSDLDNCFKQLNDCLSKKYGFNDNLIYQISAEKIIVPKGKEFIDFNIISCDNL